MLEAATAPFFHFTDFLCVFTVVSNIYTGLECTEHTCYDVILINHDLKKGINAIQFARSLRNIGARMPIILVGDQSSSDLLHMDSGTLFCCLLQKPFSASVLSEVILTSMERNIASIRLENRSQMHVNELITSDTKRNYNNDVNNRTNNNTSSLDNNLFFHSLNINSITTARASILSTVYDRPQDDLDAYTDRSSSSHNGCAPVGGKMDSSSDLNIDSLLQHGDFDQVYLSNCNDEPNPFI